MIYNVHERRLRIADADAGMIIDRIASPEGIFWPREAWPPLELDGDLRIGAAGGHGPVRYTVDAYAPGSSVRFRFTRPRGLNGTHELSVNALPGDSWVLRHVLAARLEGSARLTWPLFFGPMHDALIEDGLDRTEAVFGGAPSPRQWSRWVQTIRWLIARVQAARTPTHLLTL